jgi:hypothetical protein
MEALVAYKYALGCIEIAAAIDTSTSGSSSANPRVLRAAKVALEGAVRCQSACGMERVDHLKGLACLSTLREAIQPGRSLAPAIATRQLSSLALEENETPTSLIGSADGDLLKVVSLLRANVAHSILSVHQSIGPDAPGTAVGNSKLLLPNLLVTPVPTILVKWALLAVCGFHAQEKAAIYAAEDFLEDAKMETAESETENAVSEEAAIASQTLSMDICCLLACVAALIEDGGDTHSTEAIFLAKQAVKISIGNPVAWALLCQAKCIVSHSGDESAQSPEPEPKEQPPEEDKDSSCQDSAPSAGADSSPLQLHSMSPLACALQSLEQSTRELVSPRVGAPGGDNDVYRPDVLLLPEFTYARAALLVTGLSSVAMNTEAVGSEEGNSATVEFPIPTNRATSPHYLLRKALLLLPTHSLVRRALAQE